MSEQTPAQYLAAFVMEQIVTQPTEKRILLYRAFADQTKDAEAATTCRNLAADLETIERQHAALLAHFQKTGISPSKN